MANSISARASLRLDCVIDSDSTVATGTPLTMICNRQIRVLDFIFNTSVLSDQADGAILIESVTSGVATALGSIDASSDSGSTTAIRRPTQVTAAVGTQTTLIASAAVPRLSTLRIRGLAAAGNAGNDIRATGTICALPGDRYAAGASTTNYYPNNPAANRFST
jgi:hypothetical protein